MVRELPDPSRPDFCGRCGTRMVEAERGDRRRPVCPSCGWVYYAKPATGAGVIIEVDGGIVLVQRAREPYRGWWMLPAGFVEYGEDAEEAAVREAAEETGLKVEIAGLQGVYFGADDPRGAAHLIAYLAQPVGGELRPGDDASAALVFRPDGLPDRIAFEGHRRAIREWAERLARRQKAGGGCAREVR